MIAAGLEEKGWQVDLEQLTELWAVVCDVQDAQIDLVDELELLLLSGRHVGRCYVGRSVPCRMCSFWPP